jgi:hypothetical protein
MRRDSRRTFLKSASASAVWAAVCRSAPRLLATPLGLPIGLQLYTVRDLLPKDYEGTMRQLGTSCGLILARCCSLLSFRGSTRHKIVHSRWLPLWEQTSVLVRGH